ncbi:MAG: hypothetical protein ACT4P9_07920 [Betaproteobacteria bacterium]
MGHDKRADAALEFRIPLVVETLSANPKPELGVAIIVPDLANANKQVSNLLLQALQSMGFAIVSPKLDLRVFLMPEQQWHTSIVELSAPELAAYGKAAPTIPLPSGRIYAVQYSGRYAYAEGALRIILSVNLMERSRLGPFRETTFPYSRGFFKDRLEQSVKAQLVSVRK